MSFIRPGAPYIYVDGETADYIFESSGVGKSYIEDFKQVSKETIVDLLYRHWNPKEKSEKLLKDYLLKELAKKLKIKLRKKPLTKAKYIKEYTSLMKKNYKEIMKLHEGKE
jgi:hypothetical protein